ncbi:MAG: TfoX/Sxy family protein [Bifidobacteriaceae bacterium]|nr:TfoX/Sxy family protein [Bifidobacteriaceae bacterium]
MSDLTALPEIGTVLAGHLAAVGIPNADTLRDVGAREAFLRIRTRVDRGACVRMLTVQFQPNWAESSGTQRSHRLTEGAGQRHFTASCETR